MLTARTIPLATLHNVEHRAAVYRRLNQRNSIVAILRLGVPVAGVLLLLYLVVQIVIANLAEQFSIANVTLDRDELIIEAPEYGGTTANGSTYKVTAEKAAALLTNTNVLNLTNAALDMTRLDGMQLMAQAADAQYDLAAQTIFVPKEMRVIDSRQTDALLNKTFIDWSQQTLEAQGGAHIVFADGTTLDGDSMVFDGKTTEWTFTNAKMVSEQQPPPK